MLQLHFAWRLPIAFSTREFEHQSLEHLINLLLWISFLIAIWSIVILFQSLCILGLNLFQSFSATFWAVSSRKVCWDQLSPILSARLLQPSVLQEEVLDFDTFHNYSQLLHWYMCKLGMTILKEPLLSLAQAFSLLLLQSRLHQCLFLRLTLRRNQRGQWPCHNGCNYWSLNQSL